MALILTEFGYQVDAVEDGAEAWNLLQMERYDLLVTDYNMPRLNGLDLIKKIQEKSIPLPAILMSGKMPVKELKINPGLPIQSTLRKPFRIKELLASVETALALPSSSGQSVWAG